MIRRILLGLLAAVLLGLAALYAIYRVDAQARLDAFDAGARIIDTRVGPVEYRLEGDPDGPVLAFVHGSPGGYDSAPPPDPGVQVLAYSRPGYLRTPLSAGHTSMEQADLLAALLDALAIDRAAVMGVSGGGPSAYAFAHRYPERTTALIGLEALSFAIPAEEADDVLPTDFLLWPAFKGLEAIYDDAELVQTVMADDPDLDRLLADSAVTAEIAELIWTLWPASLRGPGYDNDNLEFQRFDLDLSEIRVPTLIVHGTLDTSVPVEHGTFAAEQIPGARIHLIEDAGHLMPWAHAEEMDGVISAFLAEHTD